MLLDPVELTQALVRCPSVTPADAGAMAVVAGALERLGFTVTQLTFGGDVPGAKPVKNLFATRGNGRPHLAFNGHVDVVPPGDVDAWRHGPFDGLIDGDCLFGRGTTDMKSGVACFIAAIARVLEQQPALPGQISLMITGDEEGVAHFGTKPLVAWAAAQGHTFDGCLVGEPTSLSVLGDNAKIGRRGSATAELTVHGVQGHTAYGHRATNAATLMVKCLDAITAEPIDTGSQFFQPTSLEITTIDVGNPANNIIPGKAFARFNMRYNETQSVARLEDWLRAKIAPVAEDYELSIATSGDAFLTDEGPLTEALAQSIAAKTGQAVKFSTDGGTSDARFIKDYAPVVEFGLTGATMHQIDERVSLDEIGRLTHIYSDFIVRFLNADID